MEKGKNIGLFTASNIHTTHAGLYFPPTKSFICTVGL